LPLLTTDDTNLTHEWVATERQTEVLRLISEAPAGSTTIIGYGGAAGGAKTNLDANVALEFALQCPGSQILVGRQDFVDLKTTTLAEFDRAIPPGLDVVYYNSPPVYRDVRLSSDVPYSRVYFRSLEHWQSILSEAYGWVIIDEAQEVAEQAILGLLTRLRHLPEKKWGIIATFNPFPSWCVDWFMRQDFSDEAKQLMAEANVSVHFVVSKIEDNPHLRPGYKQMMEATLDPYMKAVMVDGDPEAALGGLLYFDRPSLLLLETYASDPQEKEPTYPDGTGGVPDGEILIWERPLSTERYFAGADTADGRGEAVALLPDKGGSDRNSCAIYRVSDNTQVAAVYGRQEEHNYARALNRLCTWYNNATLCVERNRRAALTVLRQLGYPNLYWTARAADMHLIPPHNLTRQIEYGFNTDSKTRPVLLGELREAMTMRALRPRDRQFYLEAQDFLAGKVPQARPGKHDDRVFAHALAWQARKQARMPSREPEMWAGTLRM